VKQKGCIARGTLVPAWNWLSTTLLPAETAAYGAACKALVLAHKPDDAVVRATEFWQLAAEAITKALASETGRQKAQKILGDAFAVEDVADMALLLSAGKTIEQLIALLPVPVPSFNEQLVWQVREVYDRLVLEQPDVAPYVAVIVMNRLNRPWEALRLPLMVARHADETQGVGRRVVVRGGRDGGGATRVRHDERGERGPRRIVHHGGHGAPSFRRAEIIVPIALGAAHGEEQSARHDGSAVVGDTRDALRQRAALTHEEAGVA